MNPSQSPSHTPDSRRREVATLGGGCFWCTEAVFNEICGVETVVSGYSGGELANPTYQQVSTGTTGHAEVVQITFNPDQISFRELLDVFFATHDPTTRNRQGADVGPQYRSIILYHTLDQKETAEAVITELNTANLWSAPIVTEVEPFQVFYPAEAYHHDYFKRNPRQPYCQLVIAPKIAKVRKKQGVKLKAV
ncbi:peptide methionine sulfoxide reductase [miscellaneous Crenarchaeota group archaeon SMTZ1-55]|nr:MAG: peptide methionine sulfoxide reductase [miscellaneous Crenarchaeota group archaeon SMTZ1-55]